MTCANTRNGVTSGRWLPGSSALRGQLLGHPDVRRAPNEGKSLKRTVQSCWSGQAVWCSTAQDRLAANITVSETVITRMTREEGFKALGVWITFDGHFTRELETTVGPDGALTCHDGDGTRHNNCGEGDMCIDPSVAEHGPGGGSSCTGHSGHELVVNGGHGGDTHSWVSCGTVGVDHSDNPPKVNHAITTGSWAYHGYSLTWPCHEGNLSAKTGEVEFDLTFNFRSHPTPRSATLAT